ncbi:hypothetical protein B0O99DRAFT_602060 [Bisporella sp. PMI_857]|nr:hypothetical protein B0O99DRAFT_602060 [Bisporella sp. PMI_857]
MENRDNVDCENNPPESVAAYWRENPANPVRVLVSTATHLVRGEGYLAKTRFMQNLISQYHWSRDFEWDRDRFGAYNAEFGYEKRLCYFLIDHGQSPTGNDDDVPILCVPIHDALPSQIRRKLKAFPFTPLKSAPKTEYRQMNAIEKRERIRKQLFWDMGLSDMDFNFLKESPEHALWLERNIEPRFWSKLKVLEAEWQEFQEKLALGIIRRIPVQRELGLEQGKEEKSRDCTEMWDCSLLQSPLSRKECIAWQIPLVLYASQGSTIA